MPLYNEDDESIEDSGEDTVNKDIVIDNDELSKDLEQNQRYAKSQTQSDDMILHDMTTKWVILLLLFVL